MSKTGRASFEITRVFEIPGRGVVLAGQIRSGVVRARMQVHLPLNSSVFIAATVKSVEFVDHPRLADVGLIIDEESPELRSFWMQACSAGEVIWLSEADDA